MKVLVTVALAFAALSLSACGHSCKDTLCSPPCNGTSVAECNAQCDRIEGVNGPSGCGGKFNDAVSCEAGLSDSDRCNSTVTTCQSSANAYLGCVLDYCTAHPSEPNCK
ncbi:MAG: hypothetical protein QM723_19690 [Myxococcaceae bacterium]